MHELSVAQSLMNTILQTAEQHHAKSITLIRLKIGEMAGIMNEALEMGFSIVSQDTIAENARLEIETVPLKVLCKICGSQTAVKGYVFHCGDCFSKEIEIFSGREMLFDSIEIEENDLSP